MASGDALRSVAECFDRLVMSVIGSGKGGGGVHAIILSFPGEGDASVLGRIRSRVNS